MISSPLHTAFGPVPSRFTYRIFLKLRSWWQHLCMDEMTRYLSKSADLVELEYRIKAWNERDRGYHLPLR